MMMMMVFSVNKFELSSANYSWDLPMFYILSNDVTRECLHSMNELNVYAIDQLLNHSKSKRKFDVLDELYNYSHCFVVKDDSDDFVNEHLKHNKVFLQLLWRLNVQYHHHRHRIEMNVCELSIHDDYFSHV